MPPAQPLSLAVDDDVRVSALLQVPPGDTRAAYVFAHGAGAGMTHPFMAAVAEGLAGYGVASLRFQFPSMERGSKQPDPPAVAHAAVRAAVAEASRRLPGVPLFAGGKSFGGRMSSQAQAATPLPLVRGLAFIGFPLHPAGKPGIDRADHLRAVQVPMLFMQGTRDALAKPALLRSVVESLGERATLESFEDADHSFHVPARSGHTDDEVRARLVDRLTRWIGARVNRRLP